MDSCLSPRLQCVLELQAGYYAEALLVGRAVEHVSERDFCPVEYLTRVDLRQTGGQSNTPLRLTQEGYAEFVLSLGQTCPAHGLADVDSTSICASTKEALGRYQFSLIPRLNI